MGGAIAAITLVGVGGGWYVFACWRWPFVPCPRCSGTGKRPAWWGKAFRVCRRCRGSARRLRIGRRVFNRLRVLRDESRP